LIGFLPPFCGSASVTLCEKTHSRDFFGARRAALFRTWRVMGCRLACASDKEPKPFVKANVVAVNSKTDYLWHERLYHALCVSGGGSRALSHSLGCYRALNELDLIKPLNAISCVSGGAWCSSIFMFAKKYKGKAIDTEELLGPVTEPKNLSMSVLQESVAPLASGIVVKDSDEILAAKAIEFHNKEWEVWPHLIAEWLYRNFDDLKRFDMYLALNQEGIDRIKRKNPNLQTAEFLTPRTDRPKTFIINGTMVAPTGRLADADNVCSFQMSPEYTGSPYYPDNKQVMYYKGPCCCPCDKCLYKHCTVLKRTVGGGFVETFAFGGEAPQTLKQRVGEDVVVGQPEKPFSLPYPVGMSSWAPGLKMNSMRLRLNVLNIRKKYWPVTSSILPQAQPSLQYEFSDGGNINNSGILPLMQRKAKKILWICNTFSDLNDNYDWGNATAANFDPQAAGFADQLYCLFGYLSKKEGDGFCYCHNHVFEKELLFPICRTIRRLVDEGKPAVVSTAELFETKMKVLENDWWGITSFEMDFVIVYLATCKDFENQLPEDTKEELRKGKEGAFFDFPVYKTEEEDWPDALGLSIPQVNLLAAQAEYSIKMNADLLHNFLHTTSL